ncbi:CPBP family intramembrane metalloprotease [Candidatus Gracilibacteria bacterium]|nr:CPBP family intramembrane metalloprotease [Candidatus Gracilibacteria bacterium]
MLLSALLHIKPIGKLSKKGVFFIIVTLYLCSIAYYYWQFKTTGTIDGYPLGNNIISLLFAPIYEEVLFRGIILIGLLKIFTKQSSIILWSGILFGIWHLKNFPFLELDFSQNGLYRQVIYTALLGSFLSYLALKYKTIWIGVIIHYFNNIFLAPVSLLFIQFFV